MTNRSILYLTADTVLPSLQEVCPAALICADNDCRAPALRENSRFPVLLVKPNIVFSCGDIISISVKGRIHRHYRTASRNNAFLITEICNNLCVMCPQPPKPAGIIAPLQLETSVADTIDLLDDDHLPETLCITGGEPTMLNEGLIRIIDKIAQRSPQTLIHLLTNGRYFYYESYVAHLAAAARGNLLVGIPIFAHVSDIHDYIVQSRGAFDQTVAGLLNCYKQGIPIELRIVLHKKTIEYLIDLAEFIAKNFFFVKHVALMGMENMGYAKLNRSDLYIDPWDYKDTLSAAVATLQRYGIEARIFNLPLCVVNSDVHAVCAKSISDFKNIYLPLCTQCVKRNDCGGFFDSSTDKFFLTQHITPFLV
ncbi:His-Xaa-Ser system radical SAM maturase HxsC [Brenneria uluponensis]|uniref:His-Xaa-Ser system radical SAM maturase HxsC n=1 Tax=Brenneria uluponensis TaxID=3057057 RepID=UPI0028EBA8B2|nr:His-Xaa-Ser system radical SAM maturase HxsC [Brenneria ulupoensis]